MNNFFLSLLCLRFQKSQSLPLHAHVALLKNMKYSYFENIHLLLCHKTTKCYMVFKFGQRPEASLRCYSLSHFTHLFYFHCIIFFFLIFLSFSENLFASVLLISSVSFMCRSKHNVSFCYKIYVILIMSLVLSNPVVLNPKNILTVL